MFYQNFDDTLHSTQNMVLKDHHQSAIVPPRRALGHFFIPHWRENELFHNNAHTNE